MSNAVCINFILSSGHLSFDLIKVWIGYSLINYIKLIHKCKEFRGNTKIQKQHFGKKYIGPLKKKTALKHRNHMEAESHGAGVTWLRQPHSIGSCHALPGMLSWVLSTRPPESLVWTTAGTPTLFQSWAEPMRRPNYTDEGRAEGQMVDIPAVTAMPNQPEEWHRETQNRSLDCFEGFFEEQRASFLLPNRPSSVLWAP